MVMPGQSRLNYHLRTFCVWPAGCQKAAAIKG